MIYSCLTCKHSFPQFYLSCPDCGSWDSVKREGNPASTGNRPVALPDVGSLILNRIRTRIEQLDALLGDGFVPGSSILLLGPPGAGKSTLVMQILRKMNLPSLYASGEESVQQLKIRAERLRINSALVFLLFETKIENIMTHARQTTAKILVLDSIQIMQTEQSDALPGSATQIRKCAYILRRFAQERSIVLLMVGQVNKEDRLAGPRFLEHLVDVVLFMEAEGGRTRRRILYSTKNRFGSTLAKYSMEMRKRGLIFQRRGV